MPIKAIAFDLGNTLVHYYEREEFPSVLAQAIENIYAVLPELPTVSLEEALTVALSENVEQADARVRPLQDRLCRIFNLEQPLPLTVAMSVYRAFLAPIVARAEKYDDSMPILRLLREQGYKLAIASNTPWGSPRECWYEELERHSLAEAVDYSVFCMDVGWRKPAPAIFNQICARLDVKPEECMFIGDEPRWDYDGAQAFGMRAVLLDRIGKHTQHEGLRVRSLLPAELERCL
jgi:putative hydrolase of the HAD superfamily